MSAVQAPPDVWKKRITAIDRRIARLLEQKRQEIRRSIDDIEWMEIPHLRIPWFEILRADGTETELHVIRQVSEAGNREVIHAHDPSRCSQWDWCHQEVGGTKRNRYARRGQGHLHTFLGTWRVLAIIPSSADGRGLDYFVYDPSKLAQRSQEVPTWAR